MIDLSLFHGPNAGYVLELYERYQRNPESVDAATRAIFERWSPPEADGASPTEAPGTSTPAAQFDVTRTVGAARLIRYIRELGHLDAQIDPLGSAPPGDLGLHLNIHGVDEAFLAALPASIVRGPLAEESANALEGVEKLRAVYSGSIGYETDHIQNYEERSWIREAIESRRFFYGFDNNRKRELLMRLTEVETFERFLHTNFVGQKRFSLEGCDMLVPMLDSIIRNAAAAGTHEVVLGMAHRGRLNVLAHTIGRPYDWILREFEGERTIDAVTADPEGGTGDVKYHLGARDVRRTAAGELTVSLAANPSHLEA